MGLALEAFEGRWTGTRDLAVARFNIPRDTVELIAAAALTTLTPAMGALVLVRPSEASRAEVRAWLKSHGYRATRTRANFKGRGGQS